MEHGTVIDLFCGAGGLSEGFRQAGYDVLAGNDFSRLPEKPLPRHTAARGSCRGQYSNIQRMIS